MDNAYYIFGLNILSVVPLPSRPVLHPQPDVTPDVVIKFGEAPEVLTNPQFNGARYQAGPGEFLLRIDGVARYYVQNGCRITITPEVGAGDDEILLFLMGLAMGALLHQRNVLVLHAGAIAVSGASVIFSGPSGVGKSTLAAGFHQRGYPFLADDVCAIMTVNGCPAVIPGFPRLKLWADVLEKLDTDKAKLKSVRGSKHLEKYFLPIDRIQDTPFPLRSVFVLETTNTAKMEVTVLKGAAKIAPLIANTYGLRFLEGLGGKKDHFKQCAAVAAKVAVYRTVRPDKGFLLNELMDLLEATFKS